MWEADKTEHNKTIARMMSCLLEFYELVDSDDYDIAIAAEAARNCCLLYTALRDEARHHAGSESKLWTLSPNFHMWIECVEYQSAELGTPRAYWCYRDESFVGWGEQAGIQPRRC